MSGALETMLFHPLEGMTPATTPAATNFTLDQSTDAAEWVVQVDSAIVITKVGFRYGVRTGTPPTFRISIQGVDTSGNPDGVVKGGGSPASATFTPPADTTWNSTWQWISLANSYTTTRGENIALVIDYSSGTIDGSNSSSFTVTWTNLHARNFFPYAIQNNATVRTRQVELPCYGFQSATVTYGWPITAITGTAVSSNSTPDEYALKFVAPSTWWSTSTVKGIVAFLGTAGAGTDWDLVLYDTDGTSVLQSVTLDGDYAAAAAGSAARYGRWYFDETTLSAMTAGSTYRVSLKPNQTTTALTIYTITYGTANQDVSPAQGGVNCYLNTRTDAGAWTDDSSVNLKRPYLALIMSDITAPSGGSGGNTILAGSGIGLLAGV